jgi:hypothetical protein
MEIIFLKVFPSFLQKMSWRAFFTFSAGISDVQTPLRFRPASPSRKGEGLSPLADLAASKIKKKIDKYLFSTLAV